MRTGIDYYDELEEQKKKADEKYRRRRENELNDLAKVLATVEGRRLVWRILAEAGLFRSTFAGNDPITQAHLEGKKDIGYFLMSGIMDGNVQKFVQMQSEHIAKLKQEETEEKKESEKGEE